MTYIWEGPSLVWAGVLAIQTEVFHGSVLPTQYLEINHDWLLPSPSNLSNSLHIAILSYHSVQSNICNPLPHWSGQGSILSDWFPYLKPIPHERLTHRPDDGGSEHLWNVSKILPDYTNDTRQSSSYSLPCEPEISLMILVLDVTISILARNIYPEILYGLLLFHPFQMTRGMVI
jgi:hypothetical protein